MNGYEPGEDEQAGVERYLDTSDDCAHLRFNDIDIDLDPDSMQRAADEVCYQLSNNLAVELSFSRDEHGEPQLSCIRCYEHHRLVCVLSDLAEVDRLWRWARLNEARELYYHDNTVD